MRHASPCCLNQAGVMASSAAGLWAMRHQPFPQAAVVHERFFGTTNPCRNSAIDFARFRCFSRVHRSFARTQLSSLTRCDRHFAYRKYVTQPVRKELGSPMIRSRLTPRLRRVIPRIRSLNLSRLLGGDGQFPPSPPAPWPGDAGSSKEKNCWSSPTCCRFTPIESFPTDSLHRKIRPFAWPFSDRRVPPFLPFRASASIE